MKTDQYAELRAALDAGPTPGPWSACGSAGYVQAGEGHPKHTILAVAYGHDGNHQINAPGSRENGKYIAAANPEAIRALLAERDGLIEQHHRDSAELRSLCAARDEARRERDRLRIELRALIRGYVGLLEQGRDSILDMGGECDLVEVMEASDPWLKSARAALTQQEKS